ncbi:MAG: hypothetical protein ACRDOK_30030 [Streptosporangiaceae bacterium]
MTSDDRSTPSYGEQAPYLPPPRQQTGDSQPPPSGNVPPDPTQQLQSPQSPHKPKNRPWLARHRAWSAVIGIAALAVIGSVAAAVASPGKPSPPPRTSSCTGTCLGGITEPATQTIRATTPAAPPSPPPSPSPSPTPPPVVYQTLTDYQWDLIQKSPDSYVGQAYVIYGSIVQFDANTGPTIFRADAGPADNQATNTLFDGSSVPSALGPLVTGDSFQAEVTVEGSYSYTDTFGGSITVPELLIASIAQT